MARALLTWGKQPGEWQPILPHPRCGPAAILTRPDTLRYCPIPAFFTRLESPSDTVEGCRRTVGLVARVSWARDRWRRRGKARVTADPPRLTQVQPTPRLFQGINAVHSCRREVLRWAVSALWLVLVRAWQGTAGKAGVMYGEGVSWYG